MNTTLQPGDEVRVFDRNATRVGQPEGGWIGHVARVGRKLAYIDWPRASGDTPDPFRLEDGRRNDNYGGQWFRTLEQVTEDQRWSAAVGVLRDARVDIRPGHSLSLDQVEAMAAIVTGNEG